MSGAACIRTLIVDDESLARERVRDMLASDPQIEIIAECLNGHEAIEAELGQVLRERAAGDQEAMVVGPEPMHE